MKVNLYRRKDNALDFQPGEETTEEMVGTLPAEVRHLLAGEMVEFESYHKNLPWWEVQVEIKRDFTKYLNDTIDKLKKKLPNFDGDFDHTDFRTVLHQTQAPSIQFFRVQDEDAQGAATIAMGTINYSVEHKRVVAVRPISYQDASKIK